MNTNEIIVIDGTTRDGARYAFKVLFTPVSVPRTGELGYRIVKCVEMIQGNTVFDKKTYPSMEEAQKMADKMNYSIGLTPREASTIIATTFIGVK